MGTVASMRVTHSVIGGGPRLAELAPGIVKVEGIGVLMLNSFAAHGSSVSSSDSPDMIDVTADDLAVRDRIVAGRERIKTRMRAAGMSEADFRRYFG